MRRVFVIPFLLSLALSSGPARAIEKPNIIVIMADDLGYGDVSCYGATELSTPHIDRLAGRGLRFTQGYCSASTCTPTRFSFLTGMYAFRQPGAGIAPPNATALIQPGTETIASLLKRAGYATAVIGKWHLGLGARPKPDWNGELRPGPLEIGFDHCFLLPTTNDRVPSVYVEDHHVRNLDPKDPLWVGNTRPGPDHPTGSDPAVRATLKMDWSHGHNNTVHNGIGRIGFFTGGHAARWRDEDLADEWVKQSVQWIEKRQAEPFFLFFASHDLHVPRMPHERFQGKTALGFRGDAIAQLDWCVGELVGTLERLKLTEKTLIVFCSDNGPVLDDGYKDGAIEKLGRHKPAGRYRGGKYSIYEGGTRTPFITCWPGTIQPGVSDRVVCTVDLAASVAALTGQELSPDACPDSFNVLPALLGRPDAKGRDHLVQQPNRGNTLALRIGDWKVLAYANARPVKALTYEKGEGKYELYNLAEDPGETRNLAGEEPARLKAMLARLETIRTAGRSRPGREDILIADFEGEDYGAWTVTGEAFGPGPAKGTLPGQMDVSGYRGEGLVNSFYQGDRTTGTLTSPLLKVERRYMVFLIGGGGYAGTTCMNLLHDGDAVRTATGNNDEPGGTEALAPWAWDLEDLVGKTVRIQIVDQRQGGWGHVNVDHIVLTDTKPDIPERPSARARELDLTKDYLLFPIQNGARKTRVDLRIGDRNVREFDVELAVSKEATSFWSFLDVRAFAGRRATLHLSAATEESAALIVQSSDLPVTDELYRESLRPQLRFSQMLGWNNDPNGMVYYDGEWHLYFQHNPYGWSWGNMHWGHAVSRDLVHWEQLPIAIYNKRRGDWSFSGGAVVDENNTAGWQTGREKVIVASWTSTGRGECLAYSNDRGRTFTEYEGNPVVKHKGRDPKIVWYAPGEHWVMAVYDESEENERSIRFYSSANLKEWKLESRLPGYFECPELLELPVDGDPKDARWVVFAADARYALGRFDGKTFTPLHEGKHRVHYGDYYASQLFSNTPDGRRIQIGWARIAMPGMPFNQTFTLPHRLTLRTTTDGVRMFAEPVKEIEKLYRGAHAIAKGESPLSSWHLDVSGELFDVRASFGIGSATKAVGLDIGGNRIAYDVESGRLNGDAELKPVDGKVSIRVLVDRPMLEVIGNDGRVYITTRREVRGQVSRVTAFADGGGARLLDFTVHELTSIWKKS